MGDITFSVPSGTNSARKIAQPKKSRSSIEHTETVTQAFYATVQEKLRDDAAADEAFAQANLALKTGVFPTS
jgi:hypothetical protein